MDELVLCLLLCMWVCAVQLGLVATGFELGDEREKINGLVSSSLEL